MADSEAMIGRGSTSDSSKTVVLTFDNLGEAADLNAGVAVATNELGAHPSVTIALPVLLDTLGRLSLTATFFVEAVNTVRYPGAVREIADRGHEVAQHGWTHETWSGLTDQEEADILDRSTAAFSKLGVRTRGFRPPGGKLRERSAGLLAAKGIDWCSPVEGDQFASGHDLAVVPFAWRSVDVLYLHPAMAALRSGMGIDESQSTVSVERHLSQFIDGHTMTTLILHAECGVRIGGWLAAQVRLLEHLADARDRGELSVVSGAQQADAGSVRRNTDGENK